MADKKFAILIWGKGGRSGEFPSNGGAPREITMPSARRRAICIASIARPAPVAK